MNTTLIGIRYSPWTERARWALDHHNIPYTYREHIPLFGEPALRWHTRNRPSGTPPTVPVLLHPNGNILGSQAILHYADQYGDGTPLQTTSPSIAPYFSHLEPTLHAVRKRVTSRLFHNAQALSSSAAALLPKPLAPLAPFAPVFVAVGAFFIARKYRFSTEDHDDTPLLQDALDTLRDLRNGQTSLYLHNQTFSALDILYASLLQGVTLPSSLRLPTAMHDAWTRHDLIEPYADLLAWRDELYNTHRRTS